MVQAIGQTEVEVKAHAKRKAEEAKAAAHTWFVKGLVMMSAITGFQNTMTLA
jgi:hypothetical protein